MAGLDERTKTVLNLVNSARQILGMEPLADLPKGLRGYDMDCPIAVALGNEIQITGSRAVFYFSDVDEWTRDSIRHAWGTKESDCPCVWCEVLPPEISDWVVAFDKGQYPEYEEDPAEREHRIREEAARKTREEAFQIYVQQIESKLGFAAHCRALRFA